MGFGRDCFAMCVSCGAQIRISLLHGDQRRVDGVDLYVTFFN